MRSRPPMDAEQKQGRGARERLLPLVLALVVVLVALDRAWISDDGFITLRVAENLGAGHGWVWNLGERVQVSVHPLWTGLLGLLAALPGRLYLATIAASLALVGAVVYALSARLVRRGSAVASLAVGAYVLSDPLLDFSTGGLENPLSIALLGAFCLELMQRPGPRPAIAGILAGLAILARLDHALLVLPPLVAWTASDARWRSRRALAGLAPAVALPALWVLFSLFYFGVPLPNVKYAKLNTGIASAEFHEQGLVYLWDLIEHHPESAITLTAGLVVLATLAWRGRSALHAGALAGMLVFVAYVVSVGGDFMSARFFVAPVWIGLIWTCSWLSASAVPAALVALAVAATLGDAGPAPVRFDAVRTETCIGDERRYYHGVTDLGSNWPDFDVLAEKSLYQLFTIHRPVETSEPAVYAVDMAGMLPYLADPRVLWIDRVGLTDPLLARLPVAEREDWRIGHYYRRIPAGYLEARLEGASEDLDPRLAKVLDDLRLAISGPLFDRARLAAIWRWNTGAHDAALAEYVEQAYDEEPPFSLLSQFER